MTLTRRSSHPEGPILDASEDCLTSDHDNLTLAGDLHRRRDHMIEVSFSHRLSHLFEYPPPLRLAQQAGEGRALAQIPPPLVVS